VVSVEWLEKPSETDLVAVARLLSDFWREIIPDEPDLPASELAADMAESPEHRRVLMATAVEAGAIVGVARLVLDDRRGRASHGWVKYLVVRADRRRRGIGSALLQAVSTRAGEEARTRLESVVAMSHLAGTGFAAAAGAGTGLVDRQNRLYLQNLDARLLQDWVARAAERAGDYELMAFDGRCPDEWLTRFTEVIAVMNTAPRAEGVEDVLITEEQVRASQDAHLRAGDWGWTVCVCHRPSGRLVGYTELGGSPHRPWLAVQGDTAVQPGHRNLGLGRWIKATNALRLLKERPDTQIVETWNAGVNASMLKINDAMGFRPVAEWQEWRLPIHQK
jgi:GNAT superfamily N-acetyltransferase